MLGRKTYTPEELDHARTAIAAQLAAYDKLVAAVEATSDPDAEAALDAFEPLLFNNLALVLDRYFVHRLRVVAGKDGNPLNEVELIVESLMSDGAVLRANNVVKLRPGQSVSKIDVGDPIALRAAQFRQLSEAFLGEIERRFV